MKKAREKHMLEVEESCQTVNFAIVLWEGPTCEVLVKLSTWRILSVTSLPFTYTRYTLITHKTKWGYSERKTLDRFSTNTTHPSFRERATHLYREIIVASSSSLSHCCTLRGDFYPNTTHIFSECRECFGTWEVLGICQKKPVSLGECNQAYCRIQKAKEDMTLWSLLVAGAWRAQVHRVD